MPINYLNLPAIHGAAIKARGSSLSNQLAEEQLKDYTDKRTRKEKVRNIMSKGYTPPGTKTVPQAPITITDPTGALAPRTIEQPNQMIPTPGSFDRSGTAQSLYGAGEYETAMAMEKQEADRMKGAADLNLAYGKLKTEYDKHDKAGRERIMESVNIAAGIMQPLNTQFERLVNIENVPPEQAAQLIDAEYDKGVARLAGMGLDISNFPQTYDPNMGASVLKLKDQFDLDIKRGTQRETKRHHKAMEKEKKKKDTPDRRLWDTSAGATLKNLWGTQTMDGFVIDDENMEGYQKALKNLDKYRDLDHNTAAVKATEDAKKAKIDKSWKKYLPTK